MIHIIKEGKLPAKKETIWRFTCPDCGCEFECNINDFKSSEKRPNGDRIIDCPCCGRALHTSKDFNTYYTVHEVTVEPAEAL